MSANTISFHQTKQKSKYSLSKLMRESSIRQRKIQEWKAKINDYYTFIKGNIHKTDRDLLFSVRVLLSDVLTLKERIAKLEKENLSHMNILTQKAVVDSRLENVHEQIKNTLNNFSRKAKSVQFDFEEWQNTIRLD